MIWKERSLWNKMASGWLKDITEKSDHLLSVCYWRDYTFIPAFIVLFILAFIFYIFIYSLNSFHTFENITLEIELAQYPVTALGGPQTTEWRQRPFLPWPALSSPLCPALFPPLCPALFPLPSPPIFCLALPCHVLPSPSFPLNKS